MITKIINKITEVIADQKIRKVDFKSGLGDSAWLLHGLVRSMKPEVCVEIGSARGKSACHIGKALKENNKGILYAIDPHSITDWNDTDSSDSLIHMQANLHLAGVDQYVKIIRKTSEEASKDWNMTIDLIFIDGDHSYEGVKKDWELFFPYLNKQGIVIFHDTLWSLQPDPKIARVDMGVPKFVEELRTLGYPVLTICNDFGVSLVQPHIGGFQLDK